MIYFYRFHRKILFSTLKIPNLQIITPESINLEENKFVYYLRKSDWQKVSPLVTLIHPDQLFANKQEINILQKPADVQKSFSLFPDWIIEKINKREVGLGNYSYPRWKDRLEWVSPEKWQVNIVGLGNVGGTLLISLRLLGGERIATIGIFDTNEKAISRWEQEANQITDGSGRMTLPPVKIIKSEEIFNADMVVFCISIGVPAPEQEVQDVRMMQLEANSGIINYYAQRARKTRFNGIFA
ncbi:MAG: lactate dehydrogenase, partial [Candidatus Caldatribacteriota bacterium]